MNTNAVDLETLHSLRFTYVSATNISKAFYPFHRIDRQTSFSAGHGLSILHKSLSPYAQLPYNERIFQTVAQIFIKISFWKPLKKKNSY